MSRRLSRAQIGRQLRKRTDAEVRFDTYARVLYSTDASIYQIEPIGVVFPKKDADVVDIVSFAAEHQVPLLPRGAGTSLAGQAVGHAVHVDFSKYMDHIIQVNADEGWARVQPGVVLDELNRALQPTGLWFGPDVATSNRATIGGMIGNNAAGVRSILYGKTIDHVLELEVVLANGEQTTLTEIKASPPSRELPQFSSEGLSYSAFLLVPSAGTSDRERLASETVRTLASGLADEIIHRYPRVLRRVSGYNLDEFLPGKPFNLSKIIVGSEGTLALVTAAKLRLVPRPRRTAMSVVHYASLQDALESVEAILECKPAVIELMDEMMLNLTRHTRDYSRAMTFVRGEPRALLIVQFYGDTESELCDHLDQLRQRLYAAGHGFDSVQLLDPAEQDNVWKVRKAGVGLLLGGKGDHKPIAFVEDTAVPVARLPEYAQRFEDILKQHNTTAGFYAHVSVGCLHIRPLINLKHSRDIAKMRSIAAAVCDLVLEFGGALSGEHGDGLARSCFNEKLFGPRIYEAFREIKRAFDPDNILNPGKIVDAPQMTESLRYNGDAYRTLAVPTCFSYTREGGFARAIELCNGDGVCRKKLEGTMCPSYMATHDEEHSTRGRANALRAAISGVLPPERLTSRRMYKVMDLCLACKACKAECPSNVDMAKLKYEFLNLYHTQHGYPLRSHLFANIETINRLGCATVPLSNWLMRRALVKTFFQTFLGIDARRSLPPFARPTFVEWFVKREGAGFGCQVSEDGEGSPATRHLPFVTRRVALFNDCFTTYNYPHLGIAAVRVLEAAGFEVILPEKKCCGRPMITKGFLKKARENAAFNIERLNRYIDEGYVIVGIEPSCLLTLRDDYIDLLPGAQAQRLAENSYLIEELLASCIVDGRLPMLFAPRKILLHGHCHQKAIAGMAPLTRMLRAAGFEVEEVDAGCCGMAGAFGYEKEHYDISIAIGSLRLFDAIRAAGEEVTIVAPGVSCRQQIAHGTHRAVCHPVEVLADALLEGASGG